MKTLRLQNYRLLNILLAGCLAVGVLLPAGAQIGRRPAGGIRRVPPARPILDQDRQRARQIMTLYLREGQKQPYVAEQTTRLLNGRVQESQLAVRHGGPGRERMEFLSPPNMKGEIILQTNGHLFNYKPAEKRIYEGAASSEVFQTRVRQFMEDLRSGKVNVKVVGDEIVAGQNATIVEIRAEAGGKRLWIDNKTGVRLRTEELNAQGSVVQTSYFTKIEYLTAPEPRDFQPNTLPNVPHEAVFPNGPPLPNVQAAQSRVLYTIREPAMPAGFRISGVWLVDPGIGRQTTVLRYTDGVRSFALFEQPLPPKLENKGKFMGKVHHHNGVAHWSSENLVFTLIGNLRADTVDQIVDSLR
jgi:negative regulator of sigma E activity